MNRRGFMKFIPAVLATAGIAKSIIPPPVVASSSGDLGAIAQTSRQLLNLQLDRAGFPIDSRTVAAALDIPDWGRGPRDTVLDRWKKFQRDGI